MYDLPSLHLGIVLCFRCGIHFLQHLASQYKGRHAPPQALHAVHHACTQSRNIGTNLLVA
jgi:hypothetical protein